MLTMRQLACVSSARLRSITPITRVFHALLPIRTALTALRAQSAHFALIIMSSIPPQACVNSAQLHFTTQIIHALHVPLLIRTA